MVTSNFIGICPIIMFDYTGMISAVSLDLEILGMGITRIDPETLEVIDRYAIPFDFNTMFTGGEGAQGISVNGGYFHIDKDGRAIVGTQDNLFLELEMTNGEWTVSKSIDLGPYLTGEQFLIDTLYDWEGNMWFVSSESVVGYIDKADQSIHSITLSGEFIENGIAVARDGVFVLTSDAAYRFEIDRATALPLYTWRVPYDRGTELKPGTFALGSGTTPTLMGNDLIAFTDNADVQVNLLVLNREKNYTGDRIICKVPLFDPGESAVDVSVIGYNNSIIVENIYNAGGFLSDYRGLAPGLTRIDIKEDRSGYDVVWTADIRSTTVAKLSTANGLIYTYTQNLDYNLITAWYLTAVDFRTGEIIYQVLTGTGVLNNNSFGGVAIGPDGTVYQGAAGGIIAVKDGS
ncbi:MAG: hypothetical protein JW807_15595 [Spirochaetes bacterium]|nr:hypothetical protein [Spirochaetota bacterium]